MRTNSKLIAAGLAAAAALGLVRPADAGTPFWDEGVDGDLSNDRADPTGPLLLLLGSNLISGTTVAGDRDYVTLTVPVGLQLSQVIPTFFDGDDLAFIGVEAGDEVTTDPTAGDPSALLGWTHFGPTEGNVGTNILDDMGMGGGAIGFTGPLPAGNYSFWIQETSGIAVNYTLDFIVSEIPAPAGIALLSLAGMIAPLRRRRTA